MLRSYLFVPGNRPERFDKAWAAGADAVILDLEDAVAPADKPVARDAVARWLETARPVYLRINAANTDAFAEDLRLCALPGVRGVMLPKAETADAVAAVASVVRPGVAIEPIIETGRGFDQARALAQASGVSRLAFGSIDFQVDMGIEGDGEELLYFRSALVLASRLGGLEPPVDGVTTEIDDAARIAFETHRARRLGFGGKLCIHPRQVGVVNACFLPTPEQVAWAQRVMDALKTAEHAGAFLVDGRMVDAPVLAQARRILELCKDSTV